MSKKLYVGETPIMPPNEGGTGEFVKRKGETYYKINGFDAMDTFFMTVVSSTNQWMFIASNGSLTAGRKNPESALFPYYTDDKIIDNAENTGSKTIFKVHKGDKLLLWEPFSERYAGAYSIERNLYKNKFGTKILFEETNLSLGLVFRYEWAFSDTYGFVKQAEVENSNEEPLELEVLDGLQNLLPYGVESNLQASRSTLVDAYKKNELDSESGLGIFSLSSMIVDKAEPSEALSATTVWQQGLNGAQHLLSAQQLEAYRKGVPLHAETFTKAVKAAYFSYATLHLLAKSQHQWLTVAEVNQSSAQVSNLKHLLQTSTLRDTVLKDIEIGSTNLQRLVGIADGLQKGKDKLSTGRHFSNVLFNIMRGGIFANQYQIETHDLKVYIKTINKEVYKSQQAFLNALPSAISYEDLIASARKNKSGHLLRLCKEYLPLSFSRRHGDPSRPWNSFNIEIVDEDGEKTYNYEGNWRDIFQNWEALAYSFPAFVEGMITKFVNASTLDGYNPYRITREGIDWEIIEPDDPWSYIGYWGDHQIIYLQKLLEHAERHYPGKLGEMLSQKNYVYANVPYRIRSYQNILKNPNDTIDFDHDLAKTITQRCKQIGADGKMVWEDHEILTANLAEKLLVMALTKLYNFVPDGGIWLNTQRPEWNDANNALVGNGLSMVTLNYLRRFLVFAKGIFAQVDETELKIHTPVAKLLQQVAEAFANAPDEFNATQRKAFVDILGKAGEEYRTAVYENMGTAERAVSISSILDLFDNATHYAEKTIVKSKREDGLYHAYNLVNFNSEGAQIDNLYEMLEGQVGALSSGVLSPLEVLHVLDALKNSAMFRSDQYSYMLYPDRVLKTFLSKNTIPAEVVQKSKLIPALIEKGLKGLVEKNAAGEVHFGGGLNNAEDVQARLDILKEGVLGELAKADEELILNAFEEVFNHVAFTGRSGTFYGYEGLGSIYWHMVSKLILAVQENIYKAVAEQAHPEILGHLLEHYYEIRAGIGINKTPKLYGAFPTDAYSHTPGNAGVQQPGLTGQVKEDVINRWAVLGVQIRKGKINIDPVILNRDEILEKEEKLTYAGVDGKLQKRAIKPGQLAFTYCGTLFIYTLSDHAKITVELMNGERKELHEMEINAELSAEIFSRTGKVKEVHVNYPIR
jgi:hypothetical protein